MYKKFPCVIIDPWSEIKENNLIKWKKQLSKRVENEKYKLKRFLDYINHKLCLLNLRIFLSVPLI